MISKVITKIRLRKNGSWNTAIIISIMVLILGSCNERAFYVEPQPEEFKYVPPSDVGKLNLVFGDQQVTITWVDPPESNITNIVIANLNDGTETTVKADVQTISFSGLRNNEKYTFRIKSVNDIGLKSLGAEVSGFPFFKDNIPPNEVKNLIGYAGATDRDAVLIFEIPDDPDYSHAVAIYDDGNGETASNIREQFIRIRSTTSSGLERITIKTYDFSGNASPGITIGRPDEPMMELKGADDRTNETVYWYVPESLERFFDSYEVAWGSNYGTKKILGKEITYFSPIPMDGSGSVGSNDIRVSLLDDKGGSIWSSTLDYRIWVPGTLFGEDVTQMINCQLVGDQLGYIENGSRAFFDMNVMEDGKYNVNMYTANPDAQNSIVEFKINGTKIGETGPLLVTGNWSQYEWNYHPSEIELKAGKYSLELYFVHGKVNLRRFHFEKVQ